MPTPESVFDFNPFTHAYNRLFSLISTALTNRDLAKLANMTDLAATDQPTFQRRPNAADLPSVVLLMGSFDFDPFGPQSDNVFVAFDQRYSLAVAHENIAIVPINDIKLATMAALSAAGAHLDLTAPAPIGGQYCDFWRITDARDHDIDRNNRVQTLVPITLRMRLPRAFVQQL